MRVTSLKLANVRAIDAAEFRFRSGFNLIVGINGVGKSSVLDVLCLCLAAVVSKANATRVRAQPLGVNDIRVGTDALSSECHVTIGEREYSYVLHQPRERSIPQRQKVGLPREQVLQTPARAMFVGAPPEPAAGAESEGRPLAVLFSTGRAVPSERTRSKSAAAGGIAAALADAFANRELRLGELAAWMRVQKVLRTEHPSADSALLAMERAASSFLDGYRNLRADGNTGPRLLIDRQGATLPVRKLSDGERGLLALVLDLTRRLVQANPELSDPVSQAEAVVLIDEIDLHLHPTWQRNIVGKLTETFPRCQFIATTHSPQVIGEIPHDRIQMMSDGEVFSPQYSFGVDSNRVLDEIMGSSARTVSVAKLLEEISGEVDAQQYDSARAALALLVKRLGDEDPEVARIRTLLDFIEGEE